MTQHRTATSRGRTFLLPLVVALPVFFVLLSLMQGWWLVAVVESGWKSGDGNVWKALLRARHWIWAFAGISALSGLAWAWIILLPAKRYQAQLDELLRSGSTGKIDVGDQSELASLAQAFNRVLEESEKTLPKRVQAVLSSVTSGVVLMDPGGRVERANPSALRMLRKEKLAVEGTRYEEVFGRSAELVGLVRRALETQSEFPSEKVPITDPYGEIREVGAWLSWVRDQERNPVSLVLTLMDLTRLDSFTSGLKTAERMNLLGNVSNGIAHEIRNPLVSIRGLAQLLNTNPNISMEKVKSYGKVITEEADRLDRVVDRLSILASSGTGETEVFPVLKLLDSVSEMTHHLARKKSVEVRLEFEDPETTLVGKHQVLIQALLNVVINAIEASPTGGLVLIRQLVREDVLVIEIANNGPRIPPGELDDIFQPFHTTKSHGSGLGMTITESIVQDHGGKVLVRSGQDMTTFSIELPIRHDLCEREGMPDSAFSESQIHSGGKHSSDQKTPQVEEMGRPT